MEENKLNTQSVEFEYGNKTVKIETGKIARQATSSIIVTIDNLVVLTTMVARKEADPKKDFFPLAVFYQEKFYAAGKIPGGYFKREARPTEQETLTSRLIDRPIRPLFPEDFKNEIQIFCTVLSSDKNINPDIASLIGASAALSISGVPFQGPLGAARVGFIDSNYVLNPSPEELENSMLDMVVAGTEDAVLMVESEANELSEDLMLGSVLYGHQEMQKVIKACSDLRAKVNPKPWEFSEDELTAEFKSKIANSFTDEIAKAFKIADKSERGEAINAVRESINDAYEDLEEMERGKLMNAFKLVEKDVVRKSILSNEPRIDGRDLDTVRPIFVETNVLPSVHGSSLFTRGETQALVAATLGSTRDAQRIEGLNGEESNTFMLHYNFPAYSVGEIGMPLGPKRREIGHGNLAKRAIKAVLPDSEEFGYTLRVVSEITESNGSSSMASVCGTSLSLMDAGVPITNPVAGIAMGLIKEENDFAVLTDILGDEDHLGDMDFKVAGSDAGITSLQMDIKITSITAEIMEIALEQAREGRIHILDEMAKALNSARDGLADSAPKITTMKIPVDKIRDIIGPGGKIIREICETTGAKIDIDDDGTVKVAAVTGTSGEAAVARIRDIVAEPELGVIYNGKVVKTVDFGAFVNFLGAKDGLVHISELQNGRTEKTTDICKEGDEVKVKVIGFDDRGKVKLSMKRVDQETGADLEAAGSDEGDAA